MRELNGNLEINSDGFGTSLRATVPLFVKEQPTPYPNYLPDAFPGTTYSSAGRAA
jgi:hypothetical protein